MRSCAVFEAELGRPAPPLPGCLVLVVAGPQRQRRVVAQPTHVLDRPRCRTFSTKAGSPGYMRAGEHEVLPHQQAELVGELVEAIVLVDAAAPDAHHVHVRVGGRLQQVRDSGRRVSRSTKLSAGIQLAPFMKTGAPLTLTVKLLPAASRCVDHLDGPQSDARRAAAAGGPVHGERRRERVEPLRAEAVRPPPLGSVDHDLGADAIRRPSRAAPRR